MSVPSLPKDSRLAGLMGAVVTVVLSVVGAYVAIVTTTSALGVRVGELERVAREQHLVITQLRAEHRRFTELAKDQERFTERLDNSSEQFRNLCAETRAMLHEHERGEHRQTELRMTALEGRIAQCERAIGFRR